MTILESTNHSAFMLRCHLNLAVKYRRKAIGNQVSASLKSIFERFAPNYTNALLELDFESDLGGAPPAVVRQHIESQSERQ